MLLALSMVFALVACGTNNNGGQNDTQQPNDSQQGTNDNQQDGDTGAAASPVAGKKVAYIMIMPSAKYGPTPARI